MRTLPAYLMISLSYVFGGGSMIAFFVFLYAGHLNLIQIGLDDNGALLFDTGLSLCFFIQHSVMVRRTFRRFLFKFFPEAYSGAIYSIASGFFLFGVVLFWQGAADWFKVEGAARILSRVVFILPVAGFFWAVKALGSFDALGIRGILADLRGRKPRPVPFAIHGPYRLVRHPLYLLMLIMIWSCPDLTSDRLLFNTLWSFWIIAGTVWEERDLVREFGDVYREYQQKVSMLFPLKFIMGKRTPF
jgi:methanethiol S-methyltransferase